jgi:hypothetical protein
MLRYGSLIAATQF